MKRCRPARTHAHENSTEHIFSANTVGANPGNAYLRPPFGMLDEQVALYGELPYKLTTTYRF